MSRGDSTIVVHDLERRFGDFTAVDRISFEIAKGTVFGFLGPNGAGKSTTIRMLCGILAPSGGSATINGFDIYRESEQIKRSIGYMSQRFSLYLDLTVEENIDFYSGIYQVPRAKRKERKEAVLRMAGLTDRRHVLARDLAGGHKQHLALGCAILHEPLILFLDEPTTGVDPISRRSFWNLIYELAEGGVTVLVSTHHLEEAEYVNQIALLYGGRLVANGTSAQLKKRVLNDEVLELLCRPLDMALTLVRAVPGVQSVSLSGQALHICSPHIEQVRGPLMEVLKKSEIAVERLEIVRPSLEDVFVSVIETQEALDFARGA